MGMAGVYGLINCSWYRYTMFYPLYPIGIGAEWWLMYRSVEPVGDISPLLKGVWWFLLALYVPGRFLLANV